MKLPTFPGGTLQGVGASLDRALRRFGVGMRRAAPGEMLLRSGEVEPLLHLLCRPPEHTGSARPAAIVFSFDRALQVEALLASYIDHVANAGPVRVLYRASTDDHAAAYQDVMKRLRDSDIHWVRQQQRVSFRDQLLDLLDDLDTQGMLFLVDDDLVVEPIDFHDLAGFELRYTVPSLRLGRNLAYCYTLDEAQEQPPLTTVGKSDDRATATTESSPPGELLAWDWRVGRLDWAYPLSLDGHLFATAEVRAMAGAISFSSPNTLEAQLQRFAPFFLPRAGICYGKSRVLNVPFNRVQGRYRSRAGSVGAEELLQSWRDGFRVDHASYYGVCNVSAHQEFPLRLTAR
jgi:hypothetical protein